VSRFKVVGRLDGVQGGTLEVDRARGLVTVRPKGRRRTYSLPILTVAEMVLAKVVRAEIQAAP